MRKILFLLILVGLIPSGLLAQIEPYTSQPRDIQWDVYPLGSTSYSYDWEQFDLRNRWDYRFDSQGNLLSKQGSIESGNLEENWEIQWESPGKSSGTVKNAEGEILYSFEIEKSEDRILWRYFQPDGKEFRREEHSLDEKGLTTEKLILDGDGTPEQRVEYWRDEKGLILMIAVQHPDGSGIFEYTYEYIEFDEQGNWTIRDESMSFIDVWQGGVSVGSRMRAKEHRVLTY